MSIDQHEQYEVQQGEGRVIVPGTVSLASPSTTRQATTQRARRTAAQGDGVLGGGWWGRTLLARVPRMVWPFVLLSVLLVVGAVLLTRWWPLPVVAVAAVAAAVVEWANARCRHAATGTPGWTGLDAVALAVQLLVLVGGVSFIVLVGLGLAGVGVPSWAVVR